MNSGTRTTPPDPGSPRSEVGVLPVSKVTDSTLDKAEVVPTYDERVHVMREHSARPGAFRLICGASQREEYGWLLDIEHVAEPAKYGYGGVTANDFSAVNCRSCLAILEREARAAA